MDHTVKVDRKTSYRLVDTVIEIDINTLKENIGEICEAFNLRPAFQLPDIKGLPVISAEIKNRLD